MIENGPLDLKRFRLARKTAVAEDQLERFRAVTEMKLRAGLFRKTGGQQFRHHAHLGKQAMIVRQERFADVKPWEVLFLQNEHALFRASKKCSRRTPPRAATNHDCVI